MRKEYPDRTIGSVVQRRLRVCKRLDIFSQMFDGSICKIAGKCNEICIEIVYFAHDLSDPAAFYCGTDMDIGNLNYSKSVEPSRQIPDRNIDLENRRVPFRFQKSITRKTTCQAEQADIHGIFEKISPACINDSSGLNPRPVLIRYQELYVLDCSYKKPQQVPKHYYKKKKRDKSQTEIGRPCEEIDQAVFDSQ